jgi:hypothetical protein
VCTHYSSVCMFKPVLLKCRCRVTSKFIWSNNPFQSSKAMLSMALLSCTLGIVVVRGGALQRHNYLVRCILQGLLVAINPVLQVCTWGGKSEREEEKPGFFHCFWLPSFLQGPSLPAVLCFTLHYPLLSLGLALAM